MNGQEDIWKGVVFRLETVAGRDCVTVEIPSGRKLFYYTPEIKMEYNERFDAFMPQLYVKIKVSNKMMYRSTWGGDIFQDIVQATARDLCVYGTSEVKRRGFTPCISVHDEIVSLGDKEKSITEYEQAFQCKPEWAAEIPVAAEGWIGQYYRKD
jgi:DNA polymerase